MRCGRCGAENAANRRFCGACGAALALGCPACGFANAADAHFCGGCGGALGSAEAMPARRERRQVAVVFLDLVGFTDMTAELGAEDTQALLSGFLGAIDEIVARHGGTVDKHIGDCVMALFGAPVARGDDVVRAVRASLAALEAMPEISAQLGRELQVHGGIAAGDVVAGVVGSGHHAYTVTGDTVNLAARLADRAGAGEVLLADAVRLALGDQIRLEALGGVALQGFAQPQSVHRLLGLDEPTEHGCGPLIGRDTELEQLAAQLAWLRDSGEGRLVVLRGEAGVGKTRLIRELLRRAQDHGVAVHAALVLDFGAAGARDALGILARKLIEAERVAEVGAPLDPFLANMAGLPLSPEGHQLVAATPAGEQHGRQRAAFVALARKLAGQRPLLLAIEDVHWADAGTLSVLAGVAEALLGHAPVMLLLTARQDRDPIDAVWLAQAGNPPTMEIDLRPLQEAKARELAGLLLRGCRDDALARCVARAQGNPLFLEQLARHVRERSDDAVPVSIQTLIQARLDRLEPIDREALRAASVLGQQFSLSALRAVLSRSSYDPRSLVRRLFVHEVPQGHLFAHALIRDSIYDLLLRSQRRELHLRAAGFFRGEDAVLYAQHLDRADDSRAPRAYWAAALELVDSHHGEAAAGLAGRGLQLAVTAGDWFDLGCLAGRLQLDLGVPGGASDAYATALGTAPDATGRVKALVGLAEAMRLADRFDDALALLTEAEGPAAAEGQADWLARIHHLRGNLLFPMGRAEDCAREHAQALRCARQSGSPELETRALGGLADAEFARGRMISAHRAFTECCELAQRHGLSRIEAANRPMVAHTLFYMLDMAASLREADRAVALAKGIGHARAALIAQLAAAWALLYQGELDHVLTRIDEAEALVERIGAKRFEPEVLQLRAETCMWAGDASAAWAHAERALAVSRETSVGFMGASILGCIAWSGPDASIRQAALAEGEEVLAAGSAGHSVLNFRYYAIEAAILAEDWDEAERQAAALEACSRAEPLPWSIFYAARARALAGHARDPTDRGALKDLALVRNEALRFGLRPALRAIDAALAQPLR